MSLWKKLWTNSTGETVTISIHPASIIHPGTRFGEGCRVNRGVEIGPRCLLGRDVEIGAGSVLDSDVILGTGVVVDRDVWLTECVLGDRVRLGRSARVKNNAAIQYDTFLGDRVRVGSDCVIGAKCHLGCEVRVPDGANIGPGADILSPLHLADGGLGASGFRFSAYVYKDQVYICAGCRHLTLEQARAHWGRPSYRRGPRVGGEILLIIDHMTRLLAHRGIIRPERCLHNAEGEF